jgi:hypothetical protein
MDPPPMALRFHVLDSVYGHRVPSVITVFTTGHYGMGGIDFGQRNPYLVLLATDLSQYVMPRYRMVGLVFDRSGKLFVPVESPEDVIWWLPCPASRDPQPVKSVEPKHKLGLSLDAVRLRLTDGPPPTPDQGCEV